MGVLPMSSVKFLSFHWTCASKGTRQRTGTLSKLQAVMMSTNYAPYRQPCTSNSTTSNRTAHYNVQCHYLLFIEWATFSFPPTNFFHLPHILLSLPFGRLRWNFSCKLLRLYFILTLPNLCMLRKLRFLQIIFRFTYFFGPGSSVGIATGYGLDGPGTKSRWGRDFPHLSRPALGPTQPPVQWVAGLSRGKEGPGRDADHSSPSSAVVKKE